MRIRELVLALATVAMLVPMAHAKKKRAKKVKEVAPVGVELENACASEIAVKIGDHEVKVPAGAKSGEQTITGRDDWSFPLFLGGAEPIDLGLLALEPGGRYLVKMSNCSKRGADILTTNLKPLPEGLSPNAATQVRFRARQNRPLEYRSGKRGAFKPLSVAMTRYKESPGGTYAMTFRLRAAKRGPVLKMLKKELELKPAHKYLIEANVVGTEIMVKIEDEGPAVKEG